MTKLPSRSFAYKTKKSPVGKPVSSSVKKKAKFRAKYPKSNKK